MVTIVGYYWSPKPKTSSGFIILAVVFVTALLSFGSGHASAGIVLHDIKGREVSLAMPARRLVVDDGRMVLALSFLTGDPVGLIAAWPHDVDRLGRELYARYQEKFPEIDALPRSTSNAQDMVVEQIVAARPDAVLLSIYSHPTDQQLQQLDKTGIPVIFLDFVSDPLVNTDRSLEILGKAIGREEEANRIIALRVRHRADIAQRITASAGSVKPSIFLEAHASTQEPCCNSPGEAGIGKFIDFVGGRNIGDVLKNRPFGQLSLEYIIAANPEIYVATGGDYMKNRGGLLIGPNFDASQTQASLDELLARPGFSAVRSGSAHGISQQLFNSPLDILALELLAKWVHPELFADLDVEATRRELSELMAVPLGDMYWTDQQGSRAMPDKEASP